MERFARKLDEYLPACAEALRKSRKVPWDGQIGLLLDAPAHVL